MLLGSRVLRLSLNWETAAPLVLAPRSEGLKLHRDEGWEELPTGEALLELEWALSRLSSQLRLFVANSRVSHSDLRGLRDREILDLVRTSIRRREMTVLRQSGAHRNGGSETLELRRLLAQIEIQVHARLSYRGRRYKFAVGDDLAKLPGRDYYEVLSQADARRVLEGIAGEPGAPGELLAKANEKLSKDWRAPASQPDGLVLLRRISISAAVSKSEGPAITPSQMRELVARNRSLTNPRWEHTNPSRRRESPNVVLYGDEVVLRVDVRGGPEGAEVFFEIIDETSDPPEPLATVHGPNKAGTAEATWTARDLSASHVANVKLWASFTGRLDDQRSDQCAIPYLPERGLLQVVVCSLHLERPFGEHDVLIMGHGVKAKGTLDPDGVFKHPEQVPFGEYALTVGEFNTKIFAIRDGDPPFVVPAPPEAIPDSRWNEEGTRYEDEQFV